MKNSLKRIIYLSLIVFAIISSLILYASYNDEIVHTSSLNVAQTRAFYLFIKVTSLYVLAIIGMLTKKRFAKENLEIKDIKQKLHC